MDLGQVIARGHLRRGHGRPRGPPRLPGGGGMTSTAPAPAGSGAPRAGPDSPGPRGRPRQRRLRPLPRPVRRELHRARRRGGGAARLQRLGQVHGGPDGHRPDPSHDRDGPGVRARRHRAVGLQDRPGRGGPRARGPRHLRQPDGRGEPGARLPPAGRAAARWPEPWPVPTRPSRCSASAAASGEAPCRGGSNGCCRWPRCWWCRPSSWWPTSSPSGWRRWSSTPSTRACGRSTGRAPPSWWWSSRSTGCCPWPSEAVVLEHGAVAFDGPSSEAMAAVERVLAARGEKTVTVNQDQAPEVAPGSSEHGGDGRRSRRWLHGRTQQESPNGRHRDEPGPQGREERQ